LIREATRILSQKKGHSIRITIGAAEGDSSKKLHIETSHLDWINIIVNGRPRGSYDVADGTVSIINTGDFVTAGAGNGSKLEFEIQGFRDNQLVASARKVIV
jgi:hypothetical protein